MLERHGLTNVVKGAAFDVAGLMHGQAQLTRSVGEIVGMAVLETHPPFENGPLGGRKALKNLLQWARQLLDAIIRAAARHASLAAIAAARLSPV